MKKLLAIFALFAALALVPCARAQNFTTVTATHIQDASGNLISSGTICFLGTDANDVAIPFRIGGGGQAILQETCAPVSAGAIVGTFQVANPANTSPANVAYRVTVTSPRGNLRYNVVQFTGTSFNFDNYVPTFPPIALGQSVSNLQVGNLTITGTCSGCGGAGSSIFTSFQFGGNTAITGSGNYLQLTGSAIFSLTQSGSGTSLSPFVDTIALASQAQNLFLASPNGGSGTPTFRAIVAADIPAGSSCNAGQYMTGIAAGLAVNCAQVAYSQISGTPTIYYQTVQANAVAQTQRANLNFTTNFSLADSAVNNRTTVDLAATISANTSGNAATATALASTPSQCGVNNFATGIAASGNANCLQPGFSNLSGSIALGQTPLTTLGDILYVNATPALARLAGNTSSTKQFLTQTGNGTISAAPSWAAIAAGDIPSGSSCSAGQYMTGIAAGLAVNCAQVAYSQISGTPTIYYQTVQNAAGTAQTQRPTIQFTGTAVTSVADDSANNRTVVTLTAGTGGSGCNPPGTSGDVLYDGGGGACNDFSQLTISGNTLTGGASLTADLSSITLLKIPSATRVPGTTHGVILSEGAAANYVTTATGVAGQVLISNGAGADPTFQDPIVSYNYVNLFNAASATATQTSSVTRVSTFGQYGELIVTWASITGSPSSCQIQIKAADSLGNVTNNGSAVAVSPANGTSAILFTPSIYTSAQMQAVYSCSAYPSTGTFSVDFVPSITVYTAQGPQGAQAAPWWMRPTDGTNSMPMMDAAARAGFQKITDGTNTAAVKAASTAAVATDPSLVVQISPNQPAFTINAAQSGTWTVQPGNTANTTPWLINVGQFGGTNVVTGTGAGGSGIPRVTVSNDSALKLWDGTNTAAVKAASTAAVATDPSLVVQISPNQPAFTINAAQSGTWTVQPGNTANTTPWLINVGQFGGTNVVTGTGAGGSGIPRVTVSNDSALKLWDGTNTAAVKAASTAAVATDPSLVVQISPNQPAFTINAAQSGTWTVQPGNTANTTPWLINVGQFGGTNVVTGTGAGGSGIPRVTVSNDSALKLWDGTNTAAVKAASTAAVATDTSVVVALSPNSPVPAGSNLIGAVNEDRGGTALVADPCQANTKSYVSINQTANTQLVAGTSSKKIYPCSIHLVTATAQNVALVEGTGTTCATGTAGVTGFGGATAATGWNLAANGGIAYGDGSAALGAEGTAADNLCLFQSSTGQVSGGLSYVVQ